MYLDYLPHQRWWDVMLSPTSVCRYVYVCVRVCLWTTSWRQFMSECHQTWSDIPLATENEAIKFPKIKVKGQGRWGGMRSTERPSSFILYSFWKSTFKWCIFLQAKCHITNSIKALIETQSADPSHEKIIHGLHRSVMHKPTPKDVKFSLQRWHYCTYATRYKCGIINCRP